MPPMRPYVLPALAMALLVAACFGGGSDDTTTSSTAAQPAVTTSTTTPAATATTAAEAGTTTTATTTTTAAPATTAAPTTTTTTAPATTTTTAATTTSTTTTTVPPTEPPVVAIISPDPLTRFKAEFDQEQGGFGAFVAFVAEASDPDGGAVTIDWSSSDHGPLGSGESITAWLSTQRDTSQPVITATATDVSGATGAATIQVIVWIESDN